MAEDFLNQMKIINQQIQNLNEIQTQETGRMPHHNHIVHISNKKKNPFKTARGKRDTYVQRTKDEGNRRFFTVHNTSEKTLEKYL